MGGRGGDRDRQRSGTTEGEEGTAKCEKRDGTIRGDGKMTEKRDANDDDDDNDGAGCRLFTESSDGLSSFRLSKVFENGRFDYTKIQRECYADLT